MVMARTKDPSVVPIPPAKRAKKELRQPPYAETDVLLLDEVCLGVRCSRSQLYKVLPKLKVSYVLGEHSPRVVWGDVLDIIRRTSVT